MPRPNPILDALTNPAKNFLAFFVVGVLLFNVLSDGLSVLFGDSFGEMCDFTGLPPMPCPHPNHWQRPAPTTPRGLHCMNCAGYDSRKLVS